MSHDDLAVAEFAFPRRRWRWGYLACEWALVFAAAHFYWAGRPCRTGRVCPATTCPFRGNRLLTGAVAYFSACSRVCVQAKYARGRLVRTSGR